MILLKKLIIFILHKNVGPENIIVNYTSASGTAMPPTESLVEGRTTTFANGQQWTLKDGKQVQVK